MDFHKWWLGSVLNKKIFFSLIKIKRALRNTKIGAEFNVLGYIARHGHMGGGGQEPVTPSLIAKHFHMTTPMVAKTLRTLESKKYIHMTKDSHDGRKVNLSLTKSGELNFLRKLRIIHKWYRSIINKLSRKELEQLTFLLEKIANIAYTEVENIKNV